MCATTMTMIAPIVAVAISRPISLRMPRLMLNFCSAKLPTNEPKHAADEILEQTPAADNETREPASRQPHHESDDDVF